MVTDRAAKLVVTSPGRGGSGPGPGPGSSPPKIADYQDEKEGDAPHDGADPPGRKPALAFLRCRPSRLLVPAARLLGPRLLLLLLRPCLLPRRRAAPGGLAGVGALTGGRGPSLLAGVDGLLAGPRRLRRGRVVAAGLPWGEVLARSGGDHGSRKTGPGDLGSSGSARAAGDDLPGCVDHLAAGRVAVVARLRHALGDDVVETGG
ncbi:MAG: hypothetical protein ACRDKF_01070 [Actinomycetota bacterium]